MVGKDVIVVHTSDVHVDHVYTAEIHGGDGAAELLQLTGGGLSIDGEAMNF